MTTTVQQYHQDTRQLVDIENRDPYLALTGTLIIRQAHSENRHPHVVDEIPKA